MTPSLALESFIKGWERCVLTPYRDSGGRYTVGIGHLMEVGDPRDEPITQEEADELFHGDLLLKAEGVDLLFPEPLEQCQYDALCSFAFNVGLGALAGSTLRKRILGGYLDEAADQFLVWNKVRVNGAYVESRGLTKRRAAERAMFINGDYSGRP